MFGQPFSYSGFAEFGGVTGVPPPLLIVNGEFPAQEFIAGEIESVYALFGSEDAWTAVSATFTLFDQGVVVEGFDAVGAALAGETASLWTASRSVDFTDGAEFPVPPGDYIGLFRVISSEGQVFEAFGNVAVLEPAPAPMVGDSSFDGGVAA
jgi:hypothetical protein